MSFPRYPKYKDSGVEWLGEVPEHWEVVPLKRIVSMKSGVGITAERIGEEGLYPVMGGNGLRGFTAEFTHEGDYVLIGRQGALCGNINYARGRFWASEHAVVIDPRKELDETWLGELLRAMNLGQYSVSAAQPGLAVEVLAQLRVPIPPLPEQRRIGVLLSRELTRIQELVGEQQRLIDLLQEKRQAVITSAVNKGLDRNAPMKPSGVQWIGKVPAHWDMVSVGSRFDVQLGKMLDSQRVSGKHLRPYIRVYDVQWGSINIEELPSMDFNEADRKRYRLQTGDLLVNEGGSYVGRSALWVGGLEECYYQKALHRLRPRSVNDLPRFMYYVMSFATNAGIFVVGANQSTIDHLTAEKLKRHRFAFPPLEEQREIVEYLDRETAKADALVGEANCVIDLLQERRTALITAAVTGKIDVRNLAQPDAA